MTSLATISLTSKHEYFLHWSNLISSIDLEFMEPLIFIKTSDTFPSTSFHKTYIHLNSKNIDDIKNAFSIIMGIYIKFSSSIQLKERDNNI